MSGDGDKSSRNPYPEMLLGLPEVDVNLPGVRGWLLQGDDKQVVFFELESVGRIPPHSHCAQWGLVLDGEMELTVGTETKLYHKGDSYFIPAGVVHSADFPALTYVIDVFDDKARYAAIPR